MCSIRHFRRLLTAELLTLAAVLVAVTPALATGYQYDWPGYGASGALGTYSITHGVLSTGFSGCDEGGYYYVNGNPVADTYTNETSGEFWNGQAVEVWCNETVSNPLDSATCYPRWQVWNNNVRQGWWGATPAPICTSYLS